jgi:hypothetical protein
MHFNFALVHFAAYTSFLEQQAVALGTPFREWTAQHARAHGPLYLPPHGDEEVLWRLVAHHYDAAVDALRGVPVRNLLLDAVHVERVGSRARPVVAVVVFTVVTAAVFVALLLFRVDFAKPRVAGVEMPLAGLHTHIVTQPARAVRTSG